MNNDFSKLRLKQEQTQETASVHQTEQKHKGHEFASVEEIIRTDRQKVEVPPVIVERLNESFAKEPAPRRKSWWRKFFGS